MDRGPQSPSNVGLSFPPSVPIHHPADVLSINSIPQAPPVYAQPVYGTYDPSHQFQQPQAPSAYGQYQQPPQQGPSGGGYPPMASYQPPAAASSSNGSATIPYKKPPTMSVDERSKDALELCAFAMAALKVRTRRALTILTLLLSQHKEVELAKDRLREALKRLG
jgi:hypothetical protein